MASFFLQAFLSLALGGLIGLERERSGKTWVGVRTFAATGFFGYLVTLLSNPIMIAVGFAAVGALASLFYQARAQERKGVTTVLMIPFCYVLGVLVGNEFFLEAGTAAIAVTFLLAEKQQLHAFVKTIRREELVDLLLFSVITFIVFPLLPNKPYTVLGLTLNPQYAWAVVVFASAISFLMHLAAKYWQHHAAEVTAVLGGAVSSLAALTVFTEKVREKTAVAAFLALSSAGALIADVLLIAAISPLLFEKTALPLLAIVVSYLVSYAFCGKLNQVHWEPDRHPLSLPLIAKFTALFMIVSVVMNAASQSQASVLLTSILAGALSSTSAMASAGYLYVRGSLDAQTASMAFVAAALSTLVVKQSLLVARRLFSGKSALVLGLAVISGLLTWWLFR